MNWSRILTILVIFWGAGCFKSPNDNKPASAKPLVVATTAMVADIVREVGGDQLEVVGLIGEGVDPHLYKPTRADVARLTNADYIFYSGLMLEGKMVDILQGLAKDKRVFAVTENIEPSFLLSGAEFGGHPDPHLWMDVQGWMKAVEAVEQALATSDPTQATLYHQRAKDYLKQLAELDAYAQQSFATIPKSSRVLVTAHDAFNYLGRAYGLEVLGIQGLSTESEAGLGDLNGLVDTIVDRKVAAVFVETSVADKSVKALIEGAQARGHRLEIGGKLFSDAMGPSGTYEGTYVGMLDHNITVIVRALGGKAPQKGLHGKLQG